MKRRAVRWLGLLPALGLLMAGLTVAEEATTPPVPPAILVPAETAPADKPAAAGETVAGPQPAAPAPALALPHFLQTGPGQFEIIATDMAAARDTLAVAVAVWTTLAGPLDLPEQFPSPVTVRVVPVTWWTGPVLFRSIVEPGGLVSVQVRWSPEMSKAGELRRALVQALLFRRAVAWHGAVEKLRVPLWLEQGCVAWSVTRERAALLDAWQQESAQLAPPPLAALLGGAAAADDRAHELAALWLVAHLQAESGPEPRWPGLVRAVLGGEDSALAVQRYYGAFFKDDAARELWWQVGWHYQRQFNVQPMQTAAEARAWLAGRARWLGLRGSTEVVLAPAEIYPVRQLPWVAQELTARLAQIRSRMGTMHPYYLNALISLGRAYEELTKNRSRRIFDQDLKDFDRDMADGLELEQATDRALDAAEKGRADLVTPVSKP